MRYYVDGDEMEGRSGEYFCFRCDMAFERTHFEDAAHLERRAERYFQSLKVWEEVKSKRGFRRPAEAINILAIPAAEDVRREEESRSPFFRWLLCQVDRDDPIGDFAKDAVGDRRFPRAELDKERLLSHVRLSPGACGEALVALDEAWSEFESKPGRRVGLSVTVRFGVFKRDGYLCQICGSSRADGVRLEVDHKVPVAKGGTNDLTNLWTLCFPCNRGKRDSDL